MTRMRINSKVVVGHWEDKNVRERINTWCRAAAGWNDWQGAKFVRFGDNMRQVAVTEGDKVEAELKFGYAVNGFGMGDLAKVIADVSDQEIGVLASEYEQKYSVVPSLRKGGDRHSSLKQAAKIEAGIRTFLRAG